MAVRSTMTELVARMRGLIKDPTGTPHFTDEQIEAAFDRRRREVVELPLAPVAARTAAGDIEYLRWVADRAPWETGAVVLNASRVPINPASMTEDEMDGIWTFPTTQEAVYVTGLTFDLYGAAADLLDQWVAEGVSSGGSITEWETDGQKVKRGASETTDRVSLANLYRRQSLPTTASFSGTSLAPETYWSLR